MLYDSKIAEEVAGYLLEVEAIKLSPDAPFTWSSGWKSPIYCDNRVSLSDPAIRTAIKEYLSRMIKEKFPDVELIAGVATAGIAQGALVAEHLNLPFAYVRPKPKAHGMGKQIEGRILPGQKVVMVEDLISTGGSSLQATTPLLDNGCEVLGIAAIFNYGFPLADENFKTSGIPFYTLSSYEAMLPLAVSKGLIAEEQLAALATWRSGPDVWGK